MTPERWKKVEAIFNAALAFEVEERKDFVRRACADDRELLEQVGAMLANDENSESFFEPGVLGLLESSTESLPATDENINRQIGVYRLVEQLGRGGMGAVYLAERTDGEFRQQSAIKLIKRGMDTDLVLERFRHERQILADLNHPHIARLLDGGTTTEGLPYFVMEYIEGQSILEYCNENRLSIKDRLRLFLQVCSAVQFAHQKTIIHRDIKPSNVLVTTDGIAKLLDFGIAKILDGESEAGIGEITVPALRLLTPDYASPEHTQGLPVTPVSDVYSLGILLYELLTEHHPYRSRLRLPGGVEEVTKGKTAERPSEIIFAVKQDSLEHSGKGELTAETISANRNTTPTRLREELKGDLDTIVLKAINKNPDFRQQSAGQLIEEIERHLEGKSLPPDLFDSSAQLANQRIESAALSSESNVNQKNQQAVSERKLLSPRQKGIRHSVILMMLGVVGTPLIAFLSVGLKLKPTWILVFATLAILGGIMRLAYAIIFEESTSQNLLNSRLQNSTLTADEKENPLLASHFVPPGSWREELTRSIEDDNVATPFKNKRQK